MPQEKAPWLGCWDPLLITSYFTQWQGSGWWGALALLHAHLCFELPLHASPLPLLPAISGSDDRAEPASFNPRGFEPPHAQPACDASTGRPPKSLDTSYVSPSHAVFLGRTSGRRGISPAADVSWFPPPLASFPSQ